ncbi:MAG: DoxX family membrane protein [Frankiaceae bacterium]|jgi:thiosulfate dehydrogenase [quinone] large subunit|nr:DoxX family membrane protein [Frankiaceae bacterium]
MASKAGNRVARPAAGRGRAAPLSQRGAGGPLPADWASQLGWVLLPLRAFLGFVFVYAGLSKVADRRFLDDADPASLHATLVSVRPSSPIGFMLGPIESHSALFGVLIAIGETAIGLGLLSGLLTRIAAAGGVALSLGLFLTVSWNADPWFTGADLPFAFALTPLMLGGAGGVLSLDGWLVAWAAGQGGGARPPAGADRTRRGLLAAGLGAAGLLALGAASLARGSGGSPGASPGAPSDGPSGSAPSGGSATPSGSAAPSPSAESSGSPASSAPPSTPAPTATGAVVVQASAVSVGGAKLVRDPKTGSNDLWVMQLEAGQFTAVNGVCPHEGCMVDYSGASSGFFCACHNSRFTTTGQRVSGPARSGLKKVAVVLDGDQVHLA